MKTLDNKSILIELGDQGWKFSCNNCDINIDNGLYFGNKNSYKDNRNIFISGMNKENEQIIDDYTKNWELDRIAKMDVILMKMAITELQIFSNIPTKVTLNEYIELSKNYSTPKSKLFINGILDKVVQDWKAEKRIQKSGP